MTLMRPVKIKEVIDFRFQAKVSGKSSGRTQVQLVNFYKSRGTEKGKLCHVMFRLPTFWRCSATCLFTAIVLLEKIKSAWLPILLHIALCWYWILKLYFLCQIIYVLFDMQIWCKFISHFIKIPLTFEITIDYYSNKWYHSLQIKLVTALSTLNDSIVL